MSIPHLWQLAPALPPQDLSQLLKSRFESFYNANFEDEMMGVNHQLSVEIRGWRPLVGWYSAYLLTPWMLSHVFIPVDIPQDIVLPDDWSAEQRTQAPYEVIGPQVTFMLGEQQTKAHLNYDSQLGHYLLTPLAQNMMKYANNQAAFDAWAGVIQFRQETYARIQAQKEQEVELKAQEQVSRRHFLSRWTSKT